MGKVRSNSYKSGFSLLELLLTISIFGIIMSFLYGSFFQLNKQSKRIESRFDLRQEIRILEKIIRSDLSRIVFLRNYMSLAQNVLDGRQSGVIGIDELNGDQDWDQIHMHVRQKAMFVRNIESGQDPGLHEVSYYMEDNDDMPQFIRREEFYIDDDMTDGDRSIAHVLSEKVRAFDLKYLDANEALLDEWDMAEKADKIPVGIQVTLKLESPNNESITSVFQINLQPGMGTGVTWK